MTQKGKHFKREAAIAALLAIGSVEEAAKEVGISKRTLIRWLAQPEFRAAYAQAKGDMLKVATGILARNSGRAAKILGEIAEDKPQAHQGARVAAANATLHLSFEAREIEDIEERLRKLEAQNDKI